MPYTVSLRADRLEAYCKRRRWSKDDLADRADINRSTVYRTFSGQTGPGTALIAACAVIFGEDALPDLFHFGHSSERDAFDEEGAA